jgi:lactoylglutathione lyase
MLRKTNIKESLDFYCGGLGLKELRRYENEEGRFTLIFLASHEDIVRAAAFDNETSFPIGLPMIELTFNWPSKDSDAEPLEGGRNFGHIAYQVDNIYDTCERLLKRGVMISRPPRDGRMAFVKSPDNISVELLQKGKSLPIKTPWSKMGNFGEW